MTLASVIAGEKCILHQLGYGFHMDDRNKWNDSCVLTHSPIDYQTILNNMKHSIILNTNINSLRSSMMANAIGATAGISTAPPIGMDSSLLMTRSQFHGDVGELWVKRPIVYFSFCCKLSVHPSVRRLFTAIRKCDKSWVDDWHCRFRRCCHCTLYN